MRTTFNEQEWKDLDRNSKGYLWEQECKHFLKQIPNVTIIRSNPDDFKEYLSQNSKNENDITLKVKNGIKTKIITLECKYRSVPKLYDSWYDECWKDRESNIFLTNNPNIVSYKKTREAESKNQKIMSLTELIVYLGSLVYPRKEYTVYSTVSDKDEVELVNSICCKDNLEKESQLYYKKLSIKDSIYAFDLLHSITKYLMAEYIDSCLAED
jgi:hypothetical protein